ncbi:hypothetical protein HQ590_00990, partial [bacterium]|nr:hypothetical protein [bacterium]
MKRARLLSPAERWVLPLLLLASVAGHALAFVVFAVTDQVAVVSAAQATRVVALVAPGAERTVRYTLVATLDPSLIALPSAWGFSGKPWARPMGVSHQSYNWDVSPSYLDPPAAAGWASLLPLRNAAETVRAAARQLTAWRDEEPVPERPRPPTADRSMVRLAGALAQ